jgi:hypothetical protein
MLGRQDADAWVARRDQLMKLRTALLFVVCGAILRFAITAHLNWINLQTVGLILMLVGAFGLLLSVYRLMLAAGRRRRPALGPALAELVEEGPPAPEPPDSTRISEEIESAHLLAQEARPPLEAEGYTNQRIDELALAFVANRVGQGREEFITWALAQGRLGRDPNVDA